MICYASRTGTRRNLTALRDAGWRLLVSRAGVWRTEGFRYALDNGAWSDFQIGSAFDGRKFIKLLDLLGRDADWAVIPDVVAGGRESLTLSIIWMGAVLLRCDRALLAVQDGIEPADVSSLVGPTVGIFLGGSTDWKLARMADWGRFCAERGIHYHVARVNTVRRFRMALAAGATSVDGSSASRFAKTLPMLDAASRQGDLMCPRRAA